MPVQSLRLWTKRCTMETITKVDTCVQNVSSHIVFHNAACSNTQFPEMYLATIWLGYARHRELELFCHSFLLCWDFTLTTELHNNCIFQKDNPVQHGQTLRSISLWLIVRQSHTVYSLDPMLLRDPHMIELTSFLQQTWVNWRTVAGKGHHQANKRWIPKDRLIFYFRYDNS